MPTEGELSTELKHCRRARIGKTYVVGGLGDIGKGSGNRHDGRLCTGEEAVVCFGSGMFGRRRSWSLRWQSVVQRVSRRPGG